MKIKVGDNVLVIAGKDKGRTGEVLRVDHDKNKVVVAGLNMAKKTVKRSQANPQGGLLDIEMPLDGSNVMLVDLATGTARRAGYEGVRSEGTKERVLKEHGHNGGRKTTSSTPSE
jgi:large subunit ribosomal protein L24